MNPGGVNGPIRIAVMEQHKGECKARLLSEHELLEQQVSVHTAKDALRHYKKRIVKEEDAVALPAVLQAPTVGGSN